MSVFTLDLNDRITLETLLKKYVDFNYIPDCLKELEEYMDGAVAYAMQDVNEKITEAYENGEDHGYDMGLEEGQDRAYDEGYRAGQEDYKNKIKR